MKKFLTLMLVAVGLLATSCSKDESTTLPVGGDKVTFTVVAPELATRAIGDGTTATTLEYAVYDQSWNHISALDGTTTINITADVELELIDGKTYNLIFWAANADAPYTFDRAGKRMTINYDGIKSNHEKHDAFYATVKNLKVKNGLKETVELYRPFAQLNIATSDWDKVIASDETFAKTKVAVKAHDTLNLVDGTVAGGDVRLFDLEDMPTETLTLNGIDYKWLSMNYILVNEKELVEVTFNAYNANVAEKKWYNVPLQRNYRTHIVGDILTSPVDFEVIIRPAFEDENSIYTNESAQEAIDAAEDGDVVILGAGVYKEILDITGAKDITIKAAKDAEVVVAGIDHQTNGTPSTVTFENIIVDNSIVVETRAEGGWFTGTAPNIAPCVGAWGGDLTFNNCKFIVAGTSGRETGIMTWWTGDNQMYLTFDGCEFVGKDNHAQARAMQIYGKVDMEVTNCTFTTAKDYTLKYVAGEGNVALFEMNNVANSENFVELGSSAYPGENYTVMFYDNVLGDGVNTVVVANDENQTIYINGVQVYATASSIQAMLNEGEDVVFACDVNIEKPTVSNGYAVTGFMQANGGTIDGNGNTLSVPGANTTWASALATKGGTIKNLTIDAGFRGIFMPGANADLYVENVVIDGPVYTFNSDGGSKDYGVYISNSTLNGWTSHSDVHKEVVYTNCNFGEGSGYAYCRPYGPTKFVGCAFEAGYAIEPRGAVSFEDCTLGGVALNAANIADLISGNMANVTLDGAAVVASQSDLAEAVAEDGATVVIPGGSTFTLPATMGNGVTIEGCEDSVLDMSTVNGSGFNDVTFKNLTIKESNKNYNGIQHSEEITFEGCVLEGVYFLYADQVTFTDCVFNQTENAYNVWTYGAKNVLFDNCEFNSTKGKGILIYQDGSTNDCVVTVKNSEFYASEMGQTWDGKQVTAMDIDSTAGTYVLNIENCTANDAWGVGSVSGVRLWNHKAGAGAVKVTVDGTVVYNK